MNIDTAKFLQLFGESFWLQTFDDRKERKELVRNFKLDFNELGENGLDRNTFFNTKKLNNEGAGIYFCVNSLQPGKDRKAENVDAVRAFFLDLDGAPLQPVLECALRPNVIVQTSVDRWHAYWIMNDYVAAERRMFKELQRAIAERFNGDRSVTDLCRVMRLPGFYNMKKEPFMVTWELTNFEDNGYSLEEIKNEFYHNNANIVGDKHSDRLLDKRKIQEISWATNDELALDAGRGNVKAAYADLDFDAARLRGAMLALDVNDYGVWIQVMLALKGATVRDDAELTESEAYEMWLSWSETGDTFNEKECEYKWQTADMRGEIGLGSLFHIATENGWLGERRNFWTKEEILAFMKEQNNAR